MFSTSSQLVTAGGGWTTIGGGECFVIEEDGVRMWGKKKDREREGERKSDVGLQLGNHHRVRLLGGSMTQAEVKWRDFIARVAICQVKLLQSTTINSHRCFDFSIHLLR